MQITQASLAGILGQNSLDERLLKREAGSKAESDRAGQAKEMAKKMETLFAGQLIKEMKRSLPSGSFLPQGSGGEMLEAVLDSALTDELAKRGLGFERAFENLGRQLEKGAGEKNSVSPKPGVMTQMQGISSVYATHGVRVLA